MKFNELRRPLFLLVVRSLLFLAFQTLIALIFLFIDSSDAWNASAAWWPIANIFTNIICLGLLINLYKWEGSNFWAIFRIEHKSIKTDLLFMLVFLLFGGLIGYLPNILIARWIFGEPQIALSMLVRPLPAWASVISVAFFPILQGLVEIPMYMLFIMPRLEAEGMHPWMSVGLVGFWLSAQHVFAPFVLNGRFIVYRLVMFLPFAILMALVMRTRPRLMPYMAVMHVMMDMSVAVMFLMK